MKNLNKIDSFGEFWPVYLSAHSSRASRACHFAGLLLGAGLAAALVSCGMVFFLVLALVPVQLGAWLGHRLSLRTAMPEVIEDRPAWAFAADVKMLALATTGRLAKEFEKLDRSNRPSRPAFSAS